MPLITRGPIIPSGTVTGTATPGLLRFHLHVGASARQAADGTPVAIFGELSASPLSQRSAPTPAPAPNQRVTLRAAWYVPGEGETGETVAHTETDAQGLFGFGVAVRGVPVDYTVVVDGPEGQPPLTASDPLRVTPL